MRRLRTVACLLVLALTVPAAICLRRELPPDRQPMIEKKYGGWSGVLRLWVRDAQGGCSAWLNRCVAAFEKSHPGVFVQPEYVDAGTLEAEGLTPPDLMLFPPGEVDADRLADLSCDALLRADLPRSDRAVPVLMGGYMWAYDAATLDGIPDSWRDLDPAVPTDDENHLWGAALLALCSSRYSESSPEATGAPSGGIELGLAEEPAEPTPAPAGGDLSCELPEDFAQDADAWRRFANGEAAALLVSAREIRRLEALSDQGKGPDWQLGAAGDGAFTDQVLYIGATPQQDDDKLDLCRAFVEHLLTPECQGELHRIGAFSVTGADSGYAPGDNLRQMERILNEKPLAMPGPFDEDWRSDAAEIVRKFTEDGGDPAALWGQLAERFRQ